MIKRFRITFALVTTLGLLYICATGMADFLEEALVGAWLFDEGAGETAKDASGNGHDGELLGPKRVNGKFGSALEFDGVDDMG